MRDVGIPRLVSIIEVEVVGKLNGRNSSSRQITDISMKKNYGHLK
jgi:hypothetical protein